MPELRITDWDKHFENAGSRKLKRLEWVSIPNKMDGSGYTALVDHPNGAAHLGAWYAIVEIASRQEIRGLLPSLTGTCRCLGRISRLPAAIFEEVIPRLIEIGWIEEIKGLTDESPKVSQDIPISANKPAENGATRQNMEWNGIEVQDKKEQQQPAAKSTPLLDGLETDAETPPDHPRVVRPAVPSQENGWFAQWWKIYWPPKHARAAAEKAFRSKVKTEARFQRVMAATREQTPEMLSREPSKRPYGATWLNGERWEDEPAAAPVNGTTPPGARPSSTDAVRALALRNLERTGQLL